MTTTAEEEASIAKLLRDPNHVLDFKTRKDAEAAYVEYAFDYANRPIGSREWVLFRDGWLAREHITTAKPQPQEWFAVVLEDGRIRSVHETRAGAYRCAGLITRGTTYHIRHATVTLGEVVK